MAGDYFLRIEEMGYGNSRILLFFNGRRLDRNMTTIGQAH